MIGKKNQVKSKKRISEYGEVFTAAREVNAMLDLVKQETERIDSRFLEPACGDGNFLVEILKRKLNVVVSKYKKSQSEFEMYIIIALSSLYGVDIRMGLPRQTPPHAPDTARAKEKKHRHPRRDQTSS